MKIYSNKKVILIWILIISFMATIGISIIIRDSKNGFGTVTFGSIKPFKLTNQTGEVITKDDLSGMVWILNFIALDCDENKSCEDVKSMIKSVNEQLKNIEIKLVSVVVDQENFSIDSLELLSKELNANKENWYLLNGTREELNKIKSQLLGDLTTAMVLDQNGVFRGIYNTLDLGDVRKMIKDAKKLI